MVSVTSLVVVAVVGACMVQTAPGAANASSPQNSTSVAVSDHSSERAPIAGTHGEVVIPKLERLPVARAIQALRAAGISGEIDVSALGTNDPTVLVCSSSPDEGRKTLAHFPVVLAPCDDDLDAPDGDDTPDVRGMTVDAATKLIRDMGYSGPVVVSKIASFRGPCAVDRICRVHPLHWAVAAGQIELFVKQPSN